MQMSFPAVRIGDVSLVFADCGLQNCDSMALISLRIQANFGLSKATVTRCQVYSIDSVPSRDFCMERDKISTQPECLFE